MSSKMQVKLVHKADGSVDIPASVAKFEMDLEVFIAQNAADEEMVAACVNAVFDQYKGASIQVPAVCTFALREMNANPANFKVLQERISDYLDTHNQGDTKDGVQEFPNSLFVIGRGRGGGVKRRCDQPGYVAPVLPAVVAEPVAEVPAAE